MKVVILCGGLGTRLREETEFRPKPMVEIGGKPILWHIMKMYAHYGFREFVLCLGYKGDTIKEYFYNYEVQNNDFTVDLGSHKDIVIHGAHEESDWRVTLSDTGEKALKGARLKQIEKYIDGDIFAVTYGDGVANLDVDKLVSFHKSHGKIATVTGVIPTSLFGDLKIDGDAVESFREKNRNDGSLVSGGFFVFDRKFFDYLSFEDTCDLEVGVMEQLAKEGELMVYKHSDFWACMDTYRDMESLNRLWREGKAEWKVW